MSYPIIEISPEWIIEQEQLGTKDKFWVNTEEQKELGNNLWLLKFPKEGTGMHWAEKVAYEITQVMGIKSPKVELAILEGKIGSLTKNFAVDGYKLYHGNQILGNLFADYDESQKFRQNDHTIGSIFQAIDTIFVNPESANNAKEQFASYLVFDALICNVDRHHENWGITRKLIADGKYIGHLAPSFDHASSMGRELHDMPSEQNKQSRYRYLNELGMEKYLQRGRGPIFVDGTGSKGPSPLELVKRCLEIEGLAPYFKKGLKSLSNLNESNIIEIITQVPDQWMGALAKDFARELLYATLHQLNELHGHNQ